MEVLDSNYISETIKLMQSHRSIRKFTKDPILPNHLLEIVKAGQGAPTSNFVQAYSVIQINNEDKKQKIGALSNNIEPIIGSAVFLLFCVDMKRLEVACHKQGVEMRYDTMENFIVGIIDVSLIAQNCLTAAESLGYGGCYIGGVRNNPELISEIVGLPDKVFPLFGMVLGVPDEEQIVKPRLPIEAVFQVDEYDEKQYPVIINKYDEIMAQYYKSRLSNNKNSSWSKTMADFYSENRRMHIKKFIEDKGFTLE